MIPVELHLRNLVPARGGAVRDGSNHARLHGGK